MTVHPLALRLGGMTEDIDRKAKAYLKEIMDNYDSEDDELPAIWDAWFDRIMGDIDNHPVYLDPLTLGGFKLLFDETYTELTGKPPPRELP